MSVRYYAFVGSWSMRPGEKGLSIYSYDAKTGGLSLVRRIHPEISVGCQYLDSEKKCLYITDESGRCRGDTVGGYVQTFRIGGAQVLTEFGGAETLLAKPSYFTLDRSGDYALVSHHANRALVTKLVANADGTFASKTVADDAGLLLIRRNRDGSLGRVCDVVLTPGQEPYGAHPFSHQHCVNADPSGALYLVCDKGQDKIYSFRVDRVRGKLKLLAQTQVGENYKPRYVAFHPEKQIVYINNERQPVLLAFRYETESGKLELVDSLRFLEKNEEGVCADIVMHPNGKTIYISVREVNKICVIGLDTDGKPRLKQKLDCAGDDPRGLCLAPDQRFLLCANLGSNSIVSFAVEPDGRLHGPVGQADAHIPGNITITLVEGEAYEN